MDILNFNKLTNEQINIIKQNMEKFLNIKDLQTYNPIYLHYEEIDNKNEMLILKNKYRLKEILNIKDNNDTDEINKNDPYIKTFTNIKLVNQYNNNEIERESFIKISPIIDVIQYMLNEYKFNHNILLPNLYQCNLIEKLNNFQNTAYIDSFFSYLGSKLVESGKCPTFPLYYGSFLGISKEFKYDITEDFSQIRYHNKFQINNNNLFKIIEEEISFSELSSIVDNNDLEELNIDISNDILNIENLNLANNNIDSPINDINTDINIPDTICNDNELEEIVSIDENYIFRDITNSLNTFKYCILKNFPVQTIFIEKLSMTLDNLIDNINYEISDIEWLSILFQICFGLSIAQKNYNFVHNDLHSSNIMFQETKDKFLYYKYENYYYKIPLYGKIVKIIDFGRATFKHGDIIYFSDVFDENGDAEGQYSYPEDNSLNGCKIKPNMSFDLARLSSTIIQHFLPSSKIYNLLKSWITDKSGYCLINDDDDFDLYKHIAKNITNAVPKKQLKKNIFKFFIKQKKNIPKNAFIYNY